MDIPRQPQPRKNRLILVGSLLATLILATVALTRISPAAPAVKRSALFLDTVKRGTMVRQVRGPGTLVPEQIRYVTALTAGRVERVLARPGTAVQAGTVLLELSNPDVHIQALQSEQQLTVARAQLVALHRQLENERLSQEGAVATAQREYEEAARQEKANTRLAKGGFIAGVEADRSRDRMKEWSSRLSLEARRLELMGSSVDAQLAVQREQVERLRAISSFQRGQVRSMTVRAGADGMLQELSLEVGQWVTPGMTLAVVAQPGRLKAVLRIPETQAREVVLGQRVSVDTRNGIIAGRVMRIDPAVQNGTVTVEVALEGQLPPGARPDMSVDGTIEIEKLDRVLHMGRPSLGSAEGAASLFRLEPGGRSAVRVPVRLGRSSVNAVEVVAGLRAGDTVILSDMSAWDSHDRVRIH